MIRCEKPVGLNSDFFWQSSQMVPSCQILKYGPQLTARFALDIRELGVSGFFWNCSLNYGVQEPKKVLFLAGQVWFQMCHLYHLCTFFFYETFLHQQLSLSETGSCQKMTKIAVSALPGTVGHPQSEAAPGYSETGFSAAKFITQHKTIRQRQGSVSTLTDAIH